MIILNSVSKEIGRRAFQHLAFKDVTWEIPRHTQVAIFGHRGTGASHLLEVIAGTLLPTTGWVTRRGTISLPRGYLRFAGFGTARALIERLSTMYDVDSHEIVDFVEAGLQTRHALDVPVRRLPAVLRRQLNVVLTYAIPFDVYLFDGSVIGGGNPAFRAFCQRAFDLRRKEAGVIVALGSSRAAAALDRSMSGAILYRSRLTLFDHISDAMAVFDSLPPEEAIPTQDILPEAALEDEEIVL